MNEWNLNLGKCKELYKAKKSGLNKYNEAKTVTVILQWSQDRISYMNILWIINYQLVHRILNWGQTITCPIYTGFLSVFLHLHATEILGFQQPFTTAPFQYFLWWHQYCCSLLVIKNLFRFIGRLGQYNTEDKY